MTKAQIYAKHGIQYKDGKILFKGAWIPELLKIGNTKTGYLVYTFSLPAGLKGTCPCDCKGCYAKTGRYNCTNVIASLARNLEIVNTDINFFINAINAQLECIGACEIRIHAAGDFKTANPAEYVNAWIEIIKTNPNCFFWTYTKMSEYESAFDTLPNANIVKSVINGIGFNFGHCEYIINTYHKLKDMGANVYICRCGIDKYQHCQNCKHCINSQFVLFLEHSTEYKAELDPRYNELKSLIEAQ